MSGHRVLRLTDIDGTPCLIALSAHHSLSVFIEDEHTVVIVESGTNETVRADVTESIADIAKMLEGGQ